MLAIAGLGLLLPLGDTTPLDPTGAALALTYRSVGDESEADPLLETLAGQRAPSGWLYASREARLTTGLRIGPASTEDDFFYFRRPHLGATAWAALAALRHNPFTGGRVR